MATKGTHSTAVVSTKQHARILLAEDDFEMRRLLARALSHAGFELVQAASGDEALDKLADQLLDEAEAFDLVIADIRMPGCTGLDLLACLRHFDWNTPVILITAFGNVETHDEAKRLGAFAVFDKPFDLEDLETAVLNAAPPIH
jgi:DNA-binding NtrC family response regulator